MTRLQSVSILLFVLPILINCRIDKLEKKCFTITCTNYKSNQYTCEHVGHILDPFTNDCVAKCDTPCLNGYCDYCACRSTNTEALMSAQPSECKRVYNGTYCAGGECLYHSMTFCGSNYANNEFSRYECFQRCDEESCGKGGTCSPEGRCDCHLGYRIDITNPRICLEISETNTITLNKTSQCTDCSDSVNKTVNSQIKQNSPVNVTANSDSNQNTTLGEDMISESTYRVYIAIFSCFALILLIATIALMVMFIKLKHALPQNEGKVKILFGEFY